MTWRRMAGMVGCGGPSLFLFFPLRLLQALMLKESVGNHGHERVSVQSSP